MRNRKNIIIGLIIFIILASAGWYLTKYYLNKKDIRISKENSISETILFEKDKITVRIFLPSDNNILVEEKKIDGNTLPVIKAENILSEYLKGLGEELRNTKLLGTYIDRQNILYIDLSNDFRQRFNGDAIKEYNLLKSLLLTVIQNIPEIADVKILIEGKEIDSVGGHFLILYGLNRIMDDDEDEKR